MEKAVPVSGLMMNGDEREAPPKSRKTILPSLRTGTRLSTRVSDVSSEAAQGKRSRHRTFMQQYLRGSASDAEMSSDLDTLLGEKSLGPKGNPLGTALDEHLMLLCYGKDMTEASMEDMARAGCDIDLSTSELANALRSVFSRFLQNDQQFSKRLQSLFEHFDKNHDQRIQYDEFSATISSLFRIHLDEGIVKRLIATLDTSVRIAA
jgi:hypothetical protein